MRISRLTGYGRTEEGMRKEVLRGMDPDPVITKQKKVRKTLILFIFENDVNVP
jgi:hypothetical protein